MTKQFRFCSCGTKLDSPVKQGRGKPVTLCSSCKNSNKAERNRRSNAKKAAEAKAVHQHITQRFDSRYSCKGSIDCQSFLASLYEEIKNNPRAVPVKLRRALTNEIEKGKGKGLFSTIFGSFCRRKRGVKITNICKLNPTDEEITAWKAQEEAAKQADERMEDYKFKDYSCIEWLMRGFDDAVDEVIDDECANDDFEIEPESAEVIPFPKSKSVKDIVYEYIVEKEKSGLTGRVTLIPLMVNRGLDRIEVEQALRELQNDGLIMLDEFNQYRMIKRAA